MTTSNPVITHLSQNSSRISRMLTVGQKSSQAQTTGDFSPVASNFGGQKFQLAAQKMRVLDLQKMGRNLPGQKQAPQLGAEIQARFVNSAGLLHISARPPGSDANWARVDMVYPRTKQAEAPQVPDDPGTLRQGSVIPKFSTFPAPGQTIESFKAQVQRDSPNRIVATRKPTRETPRPAQVGPRDRLFSRVQEITPASKEPENLLAGATSAEAEINTADATETAKSPSPSNPDSGGSPAVQRQADPVAQPKPVESSQATQENKPTQAEKKSTSANRPQVIEAGKITRESLPPAETSSVDNQPLPVSPDPEIAAAVTTDTKTNSAESQLPLARPVLDVQSSKFGATTPARKDLAQAKPVQKKSQAKPVSSNLAQARPARSIKTTKQLESAAKQLPTARPTSVTDSGASQSRDISRPAITQLSRSGDISSRPIVQRQAEKGLPTSSAQPIRYSGEAHLETARTGHLMGMDARPAPASTPKQLPASSESGPVQEVERLTSQPLHQRFEYHRLASSQLKAIQPAESFVAPRAHPLVNRTDLPLLTSYKHFSPEGQTVPSSSGERTFLSPPAPPLLDLAPPASRPPQDRRDMRQPESNPFFESQAKRQPSQTAMRSFSTLELAAQPNPMELVRTAQAPILDTTHSPVSLSNDPNPSLLEMTKPPMTNRAMVPTGESLAASKSGPSNVVQRLWEKHDEPEDIKPDPGPSIDELAEKILPLVKRLMAVEIERSGSLFR